MLPFERVPYIRLCDTAKVTAPHYLLVVRATSRRQLYRLPRPRNLEYGLPRRNRSCGNILASGQNPVLSG